MHENTPSVPRVTAATQTRVYIANNSDDADKIWLHRQALSMNEMHSTALNSFKRSTTVSSTTMILIVEVCCLWARTIWLIFPRLPSCGPRRQSIAIHSSTAYARDSSVFSFSPRFQPQATLRRARTGPPQEVAEFGLLWMNFWRILTFLAETTYRASICAPSLT